MKYDITNAIHEAIRAELQHGHHAHVIKLAQDLAGLKRGITPLEKKFCRLCKQLQSEAENAKGLGGYAIDLFKTPGSKRKNRGSNAVVSFLYKVCVIASASSGEYLRRLDKMLCKEKQRELRKSLKNDPTAGPILKAIKDHTDELAEAFLLVCEEHQSGKGLSRDIKGTPKRLQKSKFYAHLQPFLEAIKANTQLAEGLFEDAAKRISSNGKYVLTNYLPVLRRSSYGRLCNFLGKPNQKKAA